MKKIKTILPFIITISILIIIFNRINFKEVSSIFAQSNKLMLTSAGFMFLCSPTLLALRWKKILEYLGWNIKFKGILKLYWASIPISKISPSNSGDLIRAIYLRDKIKISKNLGVVIFENIFDIAVLAILAIIGSLIRKNYITLGASLLILLIIILFLIISAKIKKISNKKWQQWLNDFLFVFTKLLKQPKKIIKIFFLTFLSWMNILFFIYRVFTALHTNLNFLTIMILQPIIILFGLLPITVSGAGIRESSMILLYTGLAPKASTLAAGLAHSFMAIIILPAIGAPFLYLTLKQKIINYGK